MKKTIRVGIIQEFHRKTEKTTSLKKYESQHQNSTKLLNLNHLLLQSTIKFPLSVFCYTFLNARTN